MFDVIRDEFVVRRIGQIYASAQAESVKYHVYTDKSGRRWLVGDVPDQANYVYMEGGPNSQGFGGREITFPLVEGGELALKGPWHSNSEHLFIATGVDVRGTIPEFCVIAKHRCFRENEDYPWISDTVLKEVLFEDDRPYSPRERAELGKNHPEDIANWMANELGHSVMLYRESLGGSSNGPRNPIDPNTGKEGRYVAPPDEK